MGTRVFYGGKSVTVDMGAYEYGSFPFRVVGVLSDGDGPPQLVWNSRSGEVYRIWSCGDLSSGQWLEEATVQSNGSSASWLDADATTKTKFYRIEMKTN